MDHHYVNTVARQSGSNFYFSFFSLPRDKREAITAVYAFCRQVDDAVDLVAEATAPRTNNPGGRGRRWKEELARTYGRQADARSDPIAGDWRSNALIFSREYFEGILQGVSMDHNALRFAVLAGDRVRSSVGLPS